MSVCLCSCNCLVKNHNVLVCLCVYVCVCVHMYKDISSYLQRKYRHLRTQQALFLIINSLKGSIASFETFSVLFWGSYKHRSF